MSTRGSMASLDSWIAALSGSKCPIGIDMTLKKKKRNLNNVFKNRVFFGKIFFYLLLLVLLVWLLISSFAMAIAAAASSACSLVGNELGNVWKLLSRTLTVDTNRVTFLACE